jgi:hypothetical protein
LFSLGTESVSNFTSTRPQALFISASPTVTVKRSVFLIASLSTLPSLAMAPSMNRSHSHSQNAQASTNYKEAFALFDKRGNGRVALESLGDLLRACGQNPTIAEVRDLEKGVGGDCGLHLVPLCLRRGQR